MMTANSVIVMNITRIMTEGYSGVMTTREEVINKAVFQAYVARLQFPTNLLRVYPYGYILKCGLRKNRIVSI